MMGHSSDNASAPPSLIQTSVKRALSSITFVIFSLDLRTHYILHLKAFLQARLLPLRPFAITSQLQHNR